LKSQKENFVAKRYRKISDTKNNSDQIFGKKFFGKLFLRPHTPAVRKLKLEE